MSKCKCEGCRRERAELPGYQPCPFRVEREGLPTTEFVGHRTGLDDSRLFYLDILPLIIFVFSLGMAVGKYCL